MNTHSRWWGRVGHHRGDEGSSGNHGKIARWEHWVGDRWHESGPVGRRLGLLIVLLVVLFVCRFGRRLLGVGKNSHQVARLLAALHEQELGQLDVECATALAQVADFLDKRADLALGLCQRVETMRRATNKYSRQATWRSRPCNQPG